jgi:malate dehydrogenase (oxaloacetate-decarboxylating)(NADP+)
VRELEVVNAANTTHLETYKAFLYGGCSAQGYDRPISTGWRRATGMCFAALMLAHGHGDALVTGATRKSAHVLDLIGKVFDARRRTVRSASPRCCTRAVSC